MLRGSWLNYHIKVCKKCFYVQPSISTKAVFELYTVSSLFENYPWIVKVPLSCNLMGYLLAIIKTSGDESNLPSNGFWPKLRYMNFSVFSLTVCNRQRRLLKDRRHCKLLFLLIWTGEEKKFVCLMEGSFSFPVLFFLWFRFFLFSVLFLYSFLSTLPHSVS